MVVGSDGSILGFCWLVVGLFLVQVGGGEFFTMVFCVVDGG